MSSSSSWLLLGATGLTGRLIAEEAVRLGERPVLAGRSAERLRPLADELGLDWVVVDLTDPARIRDALEPVDVVLHAAGQYDRTTAVVVEACLATGTAYADLANEIATLQYLQTQDAAARSREIPLVFGVGFGVVASNCLAQFVVDQLPDASMLEAAIHIAAAEGSAGAAASGLDVLRGGGRVVRGGRLVPYRLGRGARPVQFADQQRLVSPTPVGDLAAAAQATGVPEITMYTSALPTGIQGLMMPAVQRALMIPAVRRQLARPPKATAQPSTPPRSQAWAHAHNDSGQTAEAWFETGDGYAFTATASVLAMQELHSQHLSGTLTPAQAFGADFALRVPDTHRHTELPHTITV